MNHVFAFAMKDNSTITLVMLSMTICLGIAIGKVKVRSFSIGVIAILFVGMLNGIFCNRFGLQLNANMTNVMKDFGLIVFIYSVGLQVGPSFFDGLKKGGLMLNLQAVAIVVLGAIVTILISIFGSESLDMMAGVYSGAISSTPGLSSALETVNRLCLGDADAVAAGYALTYPIGVIAPILCCIFIRRICKVNLDTEIGNTSDCMDIKAKQANATNISRDVIGKSTLVVFAGFFIGLLLGSISINVPIKGTEIPLKLGNTGGPLVMAILISYFGTKWGWIDSSVTNSSGMMMLREIGIAIFLALVGLTSGSKFLEISILDGAKWIFYGLLIAFLPTLLVGLIVRLHHKTNYFTLMGLIGGATTDTPALAYANNMASNHAEGLPTAAYATVYPLTVFLRIITAQVFVLIMV